MKNRLGRWFARFSMEGRPRARASAKAGARRRPPTLEQLEDRIVPAVFKVNSTADALFPPARRSSHCARPSSRPTIRRGEHHRVDGPRGLQDHHSAEVSR